MLPSSGVVQRKQPRVFRHFTNIIKMKFLNTWSTLVSNNELKYSARGNFRILCILRNKIQKYAFLLKLLAVFVTSKSFKEPNKSKTKMNYCENNFWRKPDLSKILQGTKEFNSFLIYSNSFERNFSRQAHKSYVKKLVTYTSVGILNSKCRSACCYLWIISGNIFYNNQTLLLFCHLNSM